MLQFLSWGDLIMMMMTMVRDGDENEGSICSGLRARSVGEVEWSWSASAGRAQTRILIFGTFPLFCLVQRVIVSG